MKIAVLGTGMVGRALAARLADLNESAVMGTRDVNKTLARTEKDPMGGPSFSEWHRRNPSVKVATFADAAKHGEIVINATHGQASLEALELAGRENLKGKVLLDLANMLDFSSGAPKVLANADKSLAERIQGEFPDVKVVKSLCTVNAMLMANPLQLSQGDHSVFVSGNDAEAKRRVTELLRRFGWKDVIDLGDISTARGQEMMMGLWLRLWGALKTPMFNYKIVR